MAPWIRGPTQPSPAKIAALRRRLLAGGGVGAPGSTLWQPELRPGPRGPALEKLELGMEPLLASWNSSNPAAVWPSAQPSAAAWRSAFQDPAADLTPGDPGG